MPTLQDCYPPSPPNIPPDLTVPSRSYRLRVGVVLASLFLFLIVYLALTVGSAWFSYYCFAQVGAAERPPQPNRPYVNYPTRRSDDKSDGLWIITGIASAVLCLFLVKGFFKSTSADATLRVEITPEEEPLLFAFIHQLCQDTRAPRPHRVYLTPEVNAAVFYHRSFLHLFLPARKNLLIGLGLVNCVNLSEFKAVLAHEFGHFSQKSMKLGSYVYTANFIIGSLVFGRDWLDTIVDRLRRVDIRIAIWAWAFTGVLWATRMCLQGLFKLINFANSSLSRQMEFNADLVAVSVTGSDPLIHALARLDFANDALSQAWRDLAPAADHQLFTRDLFYHQTQAQKYLRNLHKNPRLGEPPPLPEDPSQAAAVFEPGDQGIPKMWATHPSNFDREQNAKRRYVRGPVDERPPWILFQDAAAVRQRVTARFYEVVRKVKDVPFSDPEAVQAFIDAEHAETTYAERYHGLYDNRYLEPGAISEVVQAAASEASDAKRLAKEYAELYGPDLAERMELYGKHQAESELLSGLANGSLTLTGKDFPFREERYTAADVPRLQKALEKELKQDSEWLAARDRQALRLHYQMASQLDAAKAQELVQRYECHVAVQQFLHELAQWHAGLDEVLNRLAGRREVPEAEFNHAMGLLRQARAELRRVLEEAERVQLPALKNMPAGDPLGKYLRPESLVAPLRSDTRTIDGAWLAAFMGQLSSARDKARRLHFKSLGGILALQERIAQQWQEQHAAVEVRPIEEDAPSRSDPAGTTN